MKDWLYQSELLLFTPLDRQVVFTNYSNSESFYRQTIHQYTIVQLYMRTYTYFPDSRVCNVCSYARIRTNHEE